MSWAARVCTAIKRALTFRKRGLLAGRLPWQEQSKKRYGYAPRNVGRGALGCPERVTHAGRTNEGKVLEQEAVTPERRHRKSATGWGCFGYGRSGRTVSEAGMVGWPPEHDGFGPPCRAARAVYVLHDARCPTLGARCLVSVPHGFHAIGRKKWVRSRPFRVVQTVSSRKRFVAARVVVGERGGRLQGASRSRSQPPSARR